MTWFSNLLGGLFGGFSASAVEPLDVLDVGAASAGSSLLADLVNDVLSGNPANVSADLSAALSDIVPVL